MPEIGLREGERALGGGVERRGGNALRAHVGREILNLGGRFWICAWATLGPQPRVNDFNQWSWRKKVRQAPTNDRRRCKRCVSLVDCWKNSPKIPTNKKITKQTKTNKKPSDTDWYCYPVWSLKPNIFDYPNVVCMLWYRGIILWHHFLRGMSFFAWEILITINDISI